MEIKLFFAIFFSVFLAELGDKTQLATMLFAADKDVSKWLVFTAASTALIVATALGVAVGAWLAHHVEERYLHIAAGLGFVAIGIYTLLGALRGTAS